MNTTHISRGMKIITSILLGIFFLLCYFAVREYRVIVRQRVVASRGALVQSLRHHPRLTGNDVGLIQSWMTFSYINTIFHLPPLYIRDTLQISDQKYPNITVGKYAKFLGQSNLSVVERVRSVVRDYFQTIATTTPQLNTQYNSKIP